ncbi:hypothetical protein ACFWUW_18205 [Streptomyces sp. NPDC058655]
MQRSEWKPADHRLVAERVGAAVLALAASLLAAGAIAVVSVVLAYALA